MLCFVILKNVTILNLSDIFFNRLIEIGQIYEWFYSDWITLMEIEKKMNYNSVLPMIRIMLFVERSKLN